MFVISDILPAFGPELSSPIGLVTPSGVCDPVDTLDPSYWPIPSVFSVRVDSASLLRPSLDVPFRPEVDALLLPELSRLPPVAWRVPAPPLDEVLVVRPDVLLTAPDILLLALLPPPLEAEEPLLRPPPLEAWPPFLATACFVRSDADAKPRLDVLLPEDDLLPPRELLLLFDVALRLEEPPFFAAPLVVLLLPAAVPREDDFEAPFDPPLLAADPLLLAPPLEEDFEAPPREEEVVFEAVLREEELFLPAPPRPPDDLEAPLLFDLDAVLLPPRLDDLEAPFDADFDAPLLDTFEAPPRPLDVEPLLEAEPRPEELLEAPLDEALEAPLLEVLVPPLEPLPELLLPPFFAAAFLVAFAIFLMNLMLVNKFLFPNYNSCK